jgi:hypothetical protein
VAAAIRDFISVACASVILPSFSAWSTRFVACAFATSLNAALWSSYERRGGRHADRVS